VAAVKIAKEAKYMANSTWKYVKALTVGTAIEDFEGEHHISLPQDLKQCMKTNNGGRPVKNGFDTETSKGRVFKTLLSFNPSDAESMQKYFPIVRSEKSTLIPFASDPGGNFLCLQNGEVVLFLHETGAVESVAKSFTALLEKLYE
jgi:hypothetical protein